jgi:hypothetical protein
MKCDYFQLETDTYFDGPCSLTESEDPDGRYVETFHVDSRKIRIVYLSRQGQWARVTINGKLGMRYEVDRTMYSYATDDLKEFLEFKTR